MQLQSWNVNILLCYYNIWSGKVKLVQGNVFFSLRFLKNNGFFDEKPKGKPPIQNGRKENQKHCSLYNIQLIYHVWNKNQISIKKYFMVFN